MLTRVELSFLHLFRKTIIATAALALIVTALGVLYYFYATYAPNPPDYAARTVEFRERLRVANLVRAEFPSDTKLYANADEVFPKLDNYKTLPDWNNPFSREHQQKVNRLLSALYEIEYINPNTLNAIISDVRMNHSDERNDQNRRDEKNFWVLFGSLFVAYVDELGKSTDKMVEMKNSGQYDASFEKLKVENDAGLVRAVSWFIDEFQTAVNEVDEEFAEREALRLSAMLGLYVAAAAFGYFMFVMFFFLAASAEMHIRRISETLERKEN